MSEVKVGDTVRALVDMNHITKGADYTVTFANYGGFVCFTDDDGGTSYMFEVQYEIVTPETDLTQNATVFGLMSEVDQARMRALPEGDAELFVGDSWKIKMGSDFADHCTYRQRPEPIRVSITDLKGTVALDADGKPDFSTYEDEQ